MNDFASANHSDVSMTSMMVASEAVAFLPLAVGAGMVIGGTAAAFFFDAMSSVSSKKNVAGT